jgi:hypothetical protein
MSEMPLEMYRETAKRWAQQYAERPDAKDIESWALHEAGITHGNEEIDSESSHAEQEETFFMRLDDRFRNYYEEWRKEQGFPPVKFVPGHWEISER